MTWCPETIHSAMSDRQGTKNATYCMIQIFFTQSLMQPAHICVRTNMITAYAGKWGDSASAAQSMPQFINNNIIYTKSLKEPFTYVHLSKKSGHLGFMVTGEL